MRKIIFLDDFRDRRKCGADPASLAAMGTFVGGTGNLISGISSNKNAKQQIAFQQQENQLNRDWQTKQAELARQFNLSERVASQNFQQQMVTQQNEYNTPAAQVQRLTQAGINPQLAMSGGSGLTSVSASPSASNQASSPMPAGVSGLSPVSQQPFDLQIPQLLNGVSSMLTGLAEAKKAGVETDILSRSANYLIENNMLTAEGQKIANNIQKTNQFILDNVKDSKIKLAWQELRKAQFEAIVSQNVAEREDRIRAVMDSEKKLNEALTNYHGKNAELVGMHVNTYNREFNQYMSLLKSEESNNYASARLSNTQSDINEIIRGLKQNELDISDATVQQRIISIFNEALSSELLPVKLREEIESIKLSNKWKSPETIAKILGNGALLAIFGRSRIFKGLGKLKLKNPFSSPKPPRVVDYRDPFHRFYER